MSEYDYWNDTLGDDATQPYDEQEWMREWARYLEDDEPICEETSYPLRAGFEEYRTDKVGAATLASGHHVWQVYDCFYSTGDEDQELFEYMISNGVRINFEEFLKVYIG